MLSIIAFFGLAEWLARIKYTPQKYDKKWIFEYDKDKVFGLRKNIVGRFTNHTVVTNSQGYRDSEIPISA